MDRLTLLAPALLLTATMVASFLVYCAMCAAGRAPVVRGAKHNQLLGPFWGNYLVWLIGPIERLLVGRVSPNAITAVSLLFCMLTGVAAGLGHLGAAAWLFIAAGILDVLDGRVARLGNQQTTSGALFDSVSDRWGELFAFTGYVWYLRDTPWLLAVMGAICGSMMVSYTRARAEGLGVELTGGVMQRAERILLVTAATMLAAWFGANPEHVYLVGPILGIAMLVCGLGSSATAISRWLMAYRELVRRDERPAEAGSVPARAAAAATGEASQPRFAPVPAKLRESAELAPATHRL